MAYPYPGFVNGVGSHSHRFVRACVRVRVCVCVVCMHVCSEGYCQYLPTRVFFLFKNEFLIIIVLTQCLHQECLQVMFVSDASGSL